MALACKYCVMTKGLRGSDIVNLPQNKDELIEHIEREHHIPVARKGETEEETIARHQAAYPEAADPLTCRCPACTHVRKLTLMTVQ